MKNKIKKALRNYEKEDGEEIKYPLDDREEIERIITHIEQNTDLNFGVYLRCQSGGSDYWLQCEYYSKKLQHTIIWDYDFCDSYEDEADLIEVITCTARDIKAFEKKFILSLIK